MIVLSNTALLFLSVEIFFSIDISFSTLIIFYSEVMHDVVAKIRSGYINYYYDKETRIISFNRTCENLYQLKKENVLGKTYDEVFPQAKNSSFITDLKMALKGEFIHVEKFKSPITGKYLETFFVPLRDSNNNVYTVFTVGHDITAITETSEQLKTINEAFSQTR